MASETPAATAWYLEGFVDESREIWKTMLRRLPFRVGRQFDADLVLPFRGVSHRHATIYLRGSRLWLHDLGSTNGTFLNGRRLTFDHPLSDGDVIHFADHEFRLVSFSPMHAAQSTDTLTISEIKPASRILDRVGEFRRMLLENRVSAKFQPLVYLADGALLGYELLGRGMLAETELPPVELFIIAEALGLEVELSRAFRNRGLVDAELLPTEVPVFINTHPAELVESRALLDSLDQLRGRYPDRQLVLEIHEAAATDLSALKALHNSLEELEIGIAFDDFGVGQSRLVELIDVAPQYVKFDRVWIKDLHQGSAKRRELVQTLVGLLHGMAVSTVAEGVESEAEAQACRDLGFVFAQGYHFGAPSPARTFL